MELEKAMWSLYDKLISEVQDDTVKRASVGLSWTVVQSSAVGLAMGATRPKKSFPLAGTLRGMPLKQLAKYVKSWEQVEASLGLSAINSSLNKRTSIQKLQKKGFVYQEESSVFDTIAKVGEGKKVTVIGHFPVVDKLRDSCDLTILERAPKEGDLPDPAAEYLLPEQDIVLITSSTIINKTAPRLLQLTKDAFTIFIGPSTPLTSTLFEMGADMIAGVIVEDEESVVQCIQEGGDLKDYRRHVKNVNLLKTDHALAELFL